MRRMGQGMKLEEVRKKHKIKRIDFAKVHRNEEDLEEYGSDKLICPYCKEEIEYEAEEIQDILKGEPYQCPECEKWFYAEAEMSLETTCTPIEDKVIDERLHIERTYEHMDKCDAAGLDFSESIYETVEWSVFTEYARPLFENMEKDSREGKE